MLSIIIPTLNEEKYLPFLLKSIKRQDFEGKYELIVADAGSSDKTIEIAKSFGCRVVKGGLPAKGRNAGAKVAKGSKLLFLDADLILPTDFLRLSLEEFKLRKLDVVSYKLIPITKKVLIKLGFNVLYNQPIVLSEKFLANGAMAILLKKKVFEEVGGFDESILLAEDIYFLRQSFKISEFGIIRSTKVYFPLRRYEADGYVHTFVKYILNYSYMLISGKATKSKFFEYKFDHYEK